MLLLGLGAGAMPLLLSVQCPSCTSVSVDSSADALAITAAHVLPPSRAHSYRHASGLTALRRAAAGQYTVVINDAFESAKPDAGLVAPAALRHVRRALRPGGLYAVNCFLCGPLGGNGTLGALMAALEGPFGRVWAEAVPNGDNTWVFAEKAA